MALPIPLIEVVQVGEFVKNELPGYQSRERGVLLLGQKLVAGAILAVSEVGIVKTSFVGSGNGAVVMDATAPVGAGAGPGRYTATLTTAAPGGGTFTVTDPNGTVLGTVAVGATFAGAIKFVINAGSVDYSVGDKFAFNVLTGSNRYAAVDPNGTGAIATAAAVLIGATDSTIAEAGCAVMARGAELNAFLMTYPVGITQAQKATINAQLASVGLLVRP